MAIRFDTAVGVSLLFALILALPVVLFELYGFLLPAFSPREQRVVKPRTLAIPFLFAAGVLFGYFVVLPAAIHLFGNFNSSQFNVLVQAGQYYPFRSPPAAQRPRSFPATRNAPERENGLPLKSHERHDSPTSPAPLLVALIVEARP